MATYEQALAAFKLGVTGGTHLFNAMPPLLHREAGPVGVLLSDPRVTVELIGDGVHLDPEVIALSMAHLPAVHDRYQLLPHGGSMGEGYGPVVVTREPRTLDDLHGCRIAIPGLTTTAWTTLRLILRDAIPVTIPIVPYAAIFDALRNGDVDAGLIIHEGRLTYEQQGFHAVVDLGVWWHEQTGLPLPLGGNAIARRLGEPHTANVSSLLRQSIAHALAHKDDAVAWLLAGGSALSSPEAMSRYLDMYANHRTLDYGEDGRRGIEAFFERTAAAGILPPIQVDYAP